MINLGVQSGSNRPFFLYARQEAGIVGVEGVFVVNLLCAMLLPRWSSQVRRRPRAERYKRNAIRCFVK